MADKAAAYLLDKEAYFNKFIETLSENNYFEGVEKDSDDYKKLFAGAEKVFNAKLADEYKDMGNVFLLKRNNDPKRGRKAVIMYTLAAQLNHDGAAPYYSNMAAAYQFMGDTKNWIDARHKSLAIDPKYSKSHLRLGQGLLRECKYDDAIISFRKTIEFEPKNAKAYEGLAEAYLAKDDIAQATENIDKSIALDAKSSKSFEVKGQIALKKNESAAAIDAFNNAIKLDAKNAKAHEDLARVFTKEGKHQEAIDICNKILDADPNCSRTIAALKQEIEMKLKPAN